MLLVPALAFARPADPVRTFERELVAAHSATAVLQQRCGPEPATGAQRSIRAVRIISDAALPQRLGRSLSLKPGETVRHRRVQLVCGTTILSRADNWYVPGRLKPAMNALLEGSDIPFGRVILPLGPTRTTLRIIRNPSRNAVLRIEAVLRANGRLPIAVVVEDYDPAVLTAVR